MCISVLIYIRTSVPLAFISCHAPTFVLLGASAIQYRLDML